MFSVQLKWKFMHIGSVWNPKEIYPLKINCDQINIKNYTNRQKFCIISLSFNKKLIMLQQNNLSKRWKLQDLLLFLNELATILSYICI